MERGLSEFHGLNIGLKCYFILRRGTVWKSATIDCLKMKLWWWRYNKTKMWTGNGVIWPVKLLLQLSYCCRVKALEKYMTTEGLTIDLKCVLWHWLIKNLCFTITAILFFINFINGKIVFLFYQNCCQCAGYTLVCLCYIWEPVFCRALGSICMWDSD